MNVGELKKILSELDDEMLVKIWDNDFFWPICFQDTQVIDVPLDRIGEVLALVPCHGHDEDPITEDYHSGMDEISPN